MLSPVGEGLRGKMFNGRAAFFVRDLRHFGSLPGDFPSASRLCGTISFISGGMPWLGQKVDANTS